MHKQNTKLTPGTNPIRYTHSTKQQYIQRHVKRDKANA